LPDGFAEGGDDTLIMGDTEVLGLLTAGDENRVETGARFYEGFVERVEIKMQT
jgi:hypothetical protein